AKGRKQKNNGGRKPQVPVAIATRFRRLALTKNKLRPSLFQSISVARTDFFTIKLVAFNPSKVLISHQAPSKVVENILLR
ncbi:MAG: hypothetical protein ACKPEY_15850, partial [Planctomycetota bacterium]